MWTPITRSRIAASPLGQAFAQALGDKKGHPPLRRGISSEKPVHRRSLCAEDECSPAASLILADGRIWSGATERICPKARRQIRKNPDPSSRRFVSASRATFFQGFANEARCNLHLELLYGDEPHHIVEALFKRLRARRTRRASATRVSPAIAEHQGENCESMIRINGKPIWFWALTFLFFAAIIFCAWQALLITWAGTWA